MAADPSPLSPPRRHWRAWAEALFPSARTTTAPRPLVVAAYAGAGTLITVIALVRQSGAAATTTVWAEDGADFYTQALKMSFLRTLFTTYNGYMQLVPRLLAQLASSAPAGDVPGRLAVSGAIGFAVAACLVFHMARGHIASPLVRAELIAAVVLLPMATAELLDNTVNLPWWLFFATFWAFLWRPRTGAGQFVSLTFCFLTTASEPLVALFLPIGAVRALVLPSRRDQTPNIGLALGLLYQLGARLGGTNKPFTPAPLHGLVQAYAERTGLSLVGGVKGSDWLIAHSPSAAVTAGLLIVGVIVASGLITEERRVRVFTAVATITSLVCFIVPLWLRGVSGVLNGASVEEGSRYQAVPLLVLLSIMFVIAGHYCSRGAAPAAHRVPLGPRARRPVPAQALVLAICAALLFPAWVADFRGANARSDGPTWQSQLAPAAAVCRARAPGNVRVLIDPPGWSALLPCWAIS